MKTIKPVLNMGEYVFCTVQDDHRFDSKEIITFFKEKEGVTLILDKSTAEELKLSYSYISAWITLTVYSSLVSVRLIAAFSKALTEYGISCNVVAACFHDHIFVNIKDAQKAMIILDKMLG